MAGNSFGNIFKLTSFGESHGTAIGGVIDGCPSNIEIDLTKIQLQLDRRKPGQSSITTDRKEDDKVEFISGIFEGKTLGTPIAFIIKNKDQKSDDYNKLKDVFRPSHADFTYQNKFGIRDYRGGGRSSARETAVRVVAGAIAEQILSKIGISIHAYVSKINSIELIKSYHEIDVNLIDSTIVRCPDDAIAKKMIALIEQTKFEGDSLGGRITCFAKGIPVGLGEPVFDRLNADLAKAMLSINAVKGFEYGSGFEGVKLKGSEHNDSLYSSPSPLGEGFRVRSSTNHAGGILGGISNGDAIYFNVAFKPVATIMQDQNTVDASGNEVVLKGKGRHDPCVVPRAVPIVEAMAALVLVDFYLRNKVVRS